MLAQDNTVNLIGHLGIDPIISNFGNNKTVARFSIATNEHYKNKSGDWVTLTKWHSVVAWGKTAESCAKHLKKGSKVSLEGKLVYNDLNAKDGVKRKRTDIRLRRFTPLDSIMA